MPGPSEPFLPYCGPAPMPGELLAAWNPDPVAIAALLALAGGGSLVLRRAESGSGRRRGALRLALLVLFVAFLSPLCALSSALFSARVVHHVLLISVAAPLLALAFPARRVPRVPLPLLALLHVGTVWLWHAPAPYAAAMRSDGLYWLMEISLLATGVLLWQALLGARADPLRTGLAHLAIIALMGLLGALITFAPSPLYAPHVLTTEAFGLSPLEDQQLAGLVMWVPAMLPNLLAALACVRRLVDPSPAAERP